MTTSPAVTTLDSVAPVTSSPSDTSVTTSPAVTTLDSDAPVTAFSASTAPSSRTTDQAPSGGTDPGRVPISPLISSVFSGVDHLMRQLLVSRAIAGYLWEQRDKLSFSRSTDGAGVGGKIRCGDCERHWDTKLSLYKQLYPSRQNVYCRIGIFEQNWASIKLYSVKKHLKSEFCTVLNLSSSTQSDQNTELTALESLILLCIQQCKDHLPALGTKGLVQWGVLSGLNKDIIQGFGVTPNLKMRLLIGRYMLSKIFTAIETEKIKYIHVGTDGQKMNFQQKWVNFFIRYSIDGLPVTATLGVLRVFGRSTGVALRQLFKDLVTGEHLKSVTQTGKTLHDDSDSDSDDEHTDQVHIFERLKRCGIKCGMDWAKFLESLISISTDGGSDFAGIHTGLTGLLTSEVTTHMLNSYWCCNHVWDLISTDLSTHPSVAVFGFSEEFFSDLAKRCKASTLFKDSLEKHLIDEGIRPFSFCNKLDGRWEMSEHEILKKMIVSMRVLVRLKKPDDPSQYLYDEIRRVASIYICSAIREINVTTLVEPAEQHTLNPVLLYRMVEYCISRYSAIVAGTVPDQITQFFEQIQFKQEQLYMMTVEGCCEVSLKKLSVDSQ